MQINVERAFYGSSENDKVVEVTTQVQSLCKDTSGSAISIPVASATFGMDDPDPGVRKTLVIKYSTKNDMGVGSPALYRMGVDGDTLTIPCQGIAVVTALEAVYGTPDEFLNITEAFNTYLAMNPGSGSIEVGSKAFFDFFTCGSDPALGVAKSLYLHLTFSGLAEPKFLCGNDGQTLTWTVG
jgi:hypothetical protein